MSPIVITWLYAWPVLLSCLQGSMAFLISSFWPLHLQQTLASVFHLVSIRSLSAFSVPSCCQAGLRNDENESGSLPLIRLEGRLHFHACFTLRDRGAGAGGRPVEELQGFRGSSHFTLRWGGWRKCSQMPDLGGKALKRAGLVIQTGHIFSWHPVLRHHVHCHLTLTL